LTLPIFTFRDSKLRPYLPQIWALICLANVCTVLTLGLWPFHSPGNDVSWLPDRNGLRLGRFSTMISSGAFPAPDPNGGNEASLELWVVPASIWYSGTLLAFYHRGSPYQFSLRQSQRDLVLRTAGNDGQPVDIYVGEVFQKRGPVFITVTAGRQDVNVYVDGTIALRTTSVPLNAQQFSGGLIVADAPRQTESWGGRIFGMAIYNRQLTAAESSRHYLSWMQDGQPGDRTVALYRFDEHTGNVVHNRAGSGPDLTIPNAYTVVDKIVLQPFWTEYSTSWNYWGAVVKNIVGFVPYGFCFYAWLGMIVRPKRAVVLTIALGTAASVAIEVVQGFLPTRDSGTSDLITNTLGTWIGIVLYWWSTPLLLRTVTRHYGRLL
jgi:VanZ family protein